jgi:AbrB family looped-hinge helix DNA binding protein
MDTVTVSSKFQVVIPERVRREHQIRPGDKLAVIVKHGVVHLVPVRPFAHSKAMFRGIKTNWDDVRDHEDLPVE